MNENRSTLQFQEPAPLKEPGFYPSLHKRTALPSEEKTGKRARERRERERGSEWERNAKAGEQPERRGEEAGEGTAAERHGYHCETFSWHTGFYQKGLAN